MQEAKLHHSPYGYKSEVQKVQNGAPANMGGGNYTITDYKRILSQFLSTSIPN